MRCIDAWTDGVWCTDLWQLPPPRLTQNLSDRVERNFFARCPPAKRPAFLRDMDERVVGEDQGAMVPEGAPANDAETEKDKDEGDEEKGAKADLADEVTPVPSILPSAPHTKDDEGEKKPIDDGTNASTTTVRNSVDHNGAARAKRHRFQRRPTGTTPLDKKGEKRYDESLLKALMNTFFFRWWAAGFMKLCGGEPPRLTSIAKKRARKADVC
jgi:ATP-binding cassette, subfamily C (CFTR/MRP), member 1